MKSKKKIVLAYSGGLDTSIILKWLQENYDAEVICYTADVGQEIDRKKIIRNAKKLGVKNIIIENLKDIKCFPIFVSTGISQPKNNNTFFIGDSFFAFPPTFAQGASQSIEVAHELCKNLENEDNQFNVERIERTKMIDRKSKFNYFAFHLSNPLLVWIRNTLMKYLVKNNKFINSYLGKIYKN